MCLRQGDLPHCRREPYRTLRHRRPRIVAGDTHDLITCRPNYQSTEHICGVLFLLLDGVSGNGGSSGTTLTSVASCRARVLRRQSLHVRHTRSWQARTPTCHATCVSLSHFLCRPPSDGILPRWPGTRPRYSPAFPAPHSGQHRRFCSGVDWFRPPSAFYRGGAADLLLE